LTVKALAGVPSAASIAGASGERIADNEARAASRALDVGRAAVRVVERVGMGCS
jgi:hypothetical protein